MRLIRPFVLFSLLLYAASLSATTSLGLDGGGYSISMEIGHDVEPVVASLKVHTHRAPKGVFLYGNFETKTFDVKKRILSIQFVQQEKGKEPGSFMLTVEGDEATLRIDNKVITSPFGWEM